VLDFLFLIALRQLLFIGRLYHVGMIKL